MSCLVSTSPSRMESVGQSSGALDYLFYRAYLGNENKLNYTQVSVRLRGSDLRMISSNLSDRLSCKRVARIFLCEPW
jgi:hypothetical protein